MAKHLFKKGQSGNPRGRPKLPPDAVEARAYAKTFTKRAIDELARIGFDPKASVSARVTALIVLLDRGNGKPTTPLEVEQTKPLQSVTIHIPGMPENRDISG